MNKRLLALIAVIIIIIIAAVAIYSLTRPEEPAPENQTVPVIQNDTQNNQTNQTVNPNTVLIQNDAFNPRNLTIRTGTTIQWINRDNTQHQIVSDSGTFQSPVLSNGGSYNFYFAQPGVYGYRCGIHPTEIGVITVRD